MYNNESLATIGQVKQIVQDVANKTKTLFTTKKDTDTLSAEVNNIKGQLTDIISRLEALEAKTNNSENLDEPVDDDFT